MLVHFCTRGLLVDMQLLLENKAKGCRLAIICGKEPRDDVQTSTSSSIGLKLMLAQIDSTFFFFNLYRLKLAIPLISSSFRVFFPSNIDIFVGVLIETKAVLYTLSHMWYSRKSAEGRTKGLKLASPPFKRGAWWLPRGKGTGEMLVKVSVVQVSDVGQSFWRSNVQNGGCNK